METEKYEKKKSGSLALTAPQDWQHLLHTDGNREKTSQIFTSGHNKEENR